MKVGLVTGSASRLAGGLFYSVRSLAQELSRREGMEVAVHSFPDRFSSSDVSAWIPIEPVLHGTLGGSAIGFSPGLKASLNGGCLDLIHSQGIWQMWSADVVRWSRRHGRPYLISPRGMLDSWALTRARFKKWVAGVAYERSHLRDACCLHALADGELAAMRAYGLRNPVCVIPNGVALPELPGNVAGRRRVQGGRNLLFLGRIHPKKGLVAALEAWKDGRRRENGTRLVRDWNLLIGGWDQDGHMTQLQDFCGASDIPWSQCTVQEWLSAGEAAWGESGEVVFLGPAYGKDKEKLMQAVDAFFLPSFSEGLPMAVLEAWAYGLPVLMTPQCNLSEGFEAGAGIRVITEPASIQDGLRNLVEMSERDRISMGAKGRKLVEERFAWPKVAAEMHRVYEWVLGGGARPGCVVAD